VSSLLAQLPAALAASLTTIGTVQTSMAMVGVRAFARAAPHAATWFPSVTVLKPLHGAEPLLAEALESFFVQDYPSFQLVFGVQRADDPAACTVRALCARYKWVDAVLVVDPTPHGTNHKIANLINMFAKAKHDVLVVSDSDMHVAPNYIARVAAALGVPGTGLVTSLYVGRPAAAHVPAQLGAAYITQIFASGAVMARALGRQDCLGATMALTRATLRRIGGWEALSPYVADDGVLGRLVLETGQSIALAATVPATTVAETGFAALFRHELRWARTIRAMAPVGFVLSAVQFPIFWGLMTLALAPGQAWAFALLGLACVSRVVSGRMIEMALGAARTPFWLVPARDVLSMVVMAAAFMGQHVAWRGEILSTAQDRVLARQAETFATSPFLASREG
jgi:ceramide glucosyltransferase